MEVEKNNSLNEVDEIKTESPDVDVNVQATGNSLIPPERIKLEAQAINNDVEDISNEEITVEEIKVEISDSDNVTPEQRIQIDSTYTLRNTVKMTEQDMMIDDIDSSDDEFYMELVDENKGKNRTDCWDSDDSGSDILPIRRQVRRQNNKNNHVPISYTDEEECTQRLVEENILGSWYDVTQENITQKIIPFKSGKPCTGPQLPDTVIEPLDYFKLFFTDEMINKIVDETNRYAINKLSNLQLSPRSIWKTWKPVNFDEMAAFIGVILNMGLIPVENMQIYWSQQFNLKMPFFSSIFKRGRFFQIFWMLQLNENICDQTPRTRIQKVNNFISYIDSKFKDYYVPERDISIGESVVKFKGNISFITFNKNRPTKWGIRMYVLADSTNGFIYSVLPYYGSITTEQLVRPDLPVTARIVLHLYGSLTNKLPNSEGYHIYCDSYYTSLALAKELLGMKCYFTGTINKNRQFLPDIIKEPKFTDANKIIACRANEIMILSWQDERIVRTITTFYTSESRVVPRKFYDGTTAKISKPNVILKYTEHVRGIDRADQLASYYCFLRKSLKWWRKLFFWGLEICLINAYTLYKAKQIKNSKKPMKHSKFVSILVMQIIGDFREGSSSRGRPSTLDTEERLNKNLHFIFNNSKYKDCLVCSKRNVKGGRHETRFYCDTCTRKPYLHPGNCFKRYHTMKYYKL